MIDLLQYWLLSGALLAAVGWCGEAVLRRRGEQARWIWVGTGTLTVLSPLLPQLWLSGSADAISQPSGAGVLPDADVLEALAAAGSPGVALGPLVIGAWIALSAALLLIGAIVLFRLRSDAAQWRTSTLFGEPVLRSKEFGPAVIGVLDPRIVVPDSLSACPPEELRMMLDHEKEHIRSRDPLLLRFAYVVGALIPWNAALLWQIWRLGQSVEQDCDLRVIAAGTAPRKYGSLLLKMASRPRPSRAWMAAAAMAEGQSSVARRIRLLGDRSGQMRTSVTALLIIAGATSLGVWMGVPSPIHFGHGGDEGSLRGLLEPALAPVDEPGVFGLSEGPVVARFRDGVWEDNRDGQNEAALRRLKREQEGLERLLQSVEWRLKEAMPGAESSGDIRRAREFQAELEAQAEWVRSDLERAERRVELFDEAMWKVQLRAPVGGSVGGEAAAEGMAAVEGPATRGGVFRVRSNSEAATDEPEPLIYVDGVRTDRGMADIDPDDVERVEVIKGEAARALFGDEAEGGVVQIFLKGKASTSGGG